MNILTSSGSMAFKFKIKKINKHYQISECSTKKIIKYITLHIFLQSIQYIWIHSR